jgi:hypothetical protein
MKRLDRVAKAEELKANGAGEARKVKFLALKAQARKLAEEGKPKEAADAEAQAADILTLSAGTAGVGAARNAIMQRRATMVELQEIIKNEGAFYTDEEVAEAARRYKTLAMQNAQAEGGKAAADLLMSPLAERHILSQHKRRQINLRRKLG